MAVPGTQSPCSQATNQRQVCKAQLQSSWEGQSGLTAFGGQGSAGARRSQARVVVVVVLLEHGACIWPHLCSITNPNVAVK